MVRWMIDARTRWRHRLFNWSFPAIIGENPLEVGMITWGFFTGLNALLGEPPSAALQTLPQYLQTSWAAAMAIAGITVLVALKFRRDTLVASGMYLFAATMASFSVAVISNGGWSRGGAVGSFLAIIGSVCFIRGWWLKEVEAAAIRELVRNRNKEI